MKETSDRDPASPPSQTDATVVADVAPPRVVFEMSRSNPVDTAQEAVHQVMLKDDVALASHPSRVAAPSPRSIAPRPAWTREIGAAALRWNALSAEELGQTRGRPHSLSLLVQRGYGIPREDADEQVARFFEDCDRA